MISSIRNLPSPLTTLLQPTSNTTVSGNVDDEVRYNRNHHHQNQRQESQFLCSNVIGIGSTLYGIQPNHSMETDDQWANVVWQQQLPFKYNNNNNIASIKQPIITSLSSNHNCTIIAVASTDGNISLLSTNDGTVLFTVSLSNVVDSTTGSDTRDQLDSVLLATRFTWLQNSTHSDLLFVEVVSTAITAGATDGSQYYLITNITNHNPHHNEDNTVKIQVHAINLDSTNKSSSSKHDIRAITALRLPKYNDSSAIETTTRSDETVGTYSYTIRFIACDCDSQLILFDYDITSSTTTEEIHFVRQYDPVYLTIVVGSNSSTLSRNVSSNNNRTMVQFKETATYTIDYELGLFVQHQPLEEDSCFIVSSAFAHPSQPLIVWFQPSCKKIQEPDCVYPIPIQNEHPVPTTTATSSSKVMAIEMISSWNEREVLASAVAVKTTHHSNYMNNNNLLGGTSSKVPSTTKAAPTSTTTIYIVQALISTSQGEGRRICHPHLLYTIPIDVSVLSFRINPLWKINNNDIRPYTFRYQLVTNDSLPASSTFGRYVYGIFDPSDPTISVAVGKIRSLIHQNQYDLADRVVASIGSMSLILEPHISFHPLEIVFHRLQHFLEQQVPLRLMASTEIPLDDTDDTTEDPSIVEGIHLYLRELAQGVVLPASATTSLTDPQSQQTFNLFVHAIEMIRDHLSSSFELSSTISHQNILLRVITTIQNVLPNIHTLIQSERLDKICRSVEEQISVFNFLSSIPNPPKIQIRFSDVRSLGHFYEICIQEHQFVMAERIYRSTRKTNCWNIAMLVNPILLHISGANVSPKEYMFLLRDVIFPNLAINDGMLSRLIRWSCRTTDVLDKTNAVDSDLNTALLLLQTMDAEIRKLQLKIHRSFAYFSPFAASDSNTDSNSCLNISRRILPNANISVDEDDKYLSNGLLASANTSSSAGRKRKMIVPTDTLLEQPMPTILQRGALQRGPTNGTKVSVTSSDDSDDSVHVKLLQTQCLLEARSLGLQRDVLLIEHFVPFGGEQRLAKELVRLLSSSANTQEVRMQLLNEHLIPFCCRYSVNYDQALHDYVFDLCRGEGENVTPLIMEECCSVTRCCMDLNIKCRTALLILGAAIFCGKTCASVFLLSKDAINVWSSNDSGLQSEMQEAFRLLQIDDIIIRYCGAAARELFRVGNPSHSVRLLEFVTRHIECETVIDDVLLLCDAFNHLCPHQATKLILENSIQHPKLDLCRTIFEKLININVQLAETTLVRAILYSEDVLLDCCKKIKNCSDVGQVELSKKTAQTVALRIHGLLQFAIEQSMNLSAEALQYFNFSMNKISLPLLKEMFLKIQRLQIDHSIFISMEEMFRPRSIVYAILPLLEHASRTYSTQNLSTTHDNLSHARTVLSLISMLSDEAERKSWLIASSMAAVSMAKRCNFHHVLDFLKDADVLVVGSNYRLSALCHICISGALFEAALVSRDNVLKGIPSLIYSSSLLSDWSLFSFTSNDLATVIGMRSALEVACMVLSRCDEGVGEYIDSLRQKLQRCVWQARKSSETNQSATLITYKSDLHPSWYHGDGILLPPVEAFGKTLRFCTNQIQNRHILQDGILELYDLLVNRGAHTLALRMLCEVASIFACTKKQIHSKPFVMYVQDSLQDTAFALAKRNLGGTGSGITSSVVDSQQAAIFLLLLPIKQAFAAFKSCITTSMKMQNHERLRTLANIGRVTAGQNLMNHPAVIYSIGWGKQNKFLDQCQQLAVNAVWWSILQFIGVAFDSNLFNDCDTGATNSIKYAEILLPSLVKNALQLLNSCQVLSLAFDYSDTFGVSQSVVARASIEVLLDPVNAVKRIQHLERLDRSIRRCLNVLSPTSRCNILRRCLKQLECAPTFHGDYELFNLALTLYHEALVFVITCNPNMQNALFEVELELIERRRDVLSIISSFFQGNRRRTRPRFSSFFVPLADAVGHVCVVPIVGILGKVSNSAVDEFDPLEPIENVLSCVEETDVVRALAPLSIPLDIPNGFIHARSLMARFKSAKCGNAPYPSFVDDITSVLNKIESHSDRAALAEWCTNEYEKYDEYKLDCLNAVLNTTIEASTVLEKRRRHFPNDAILQQQEQEYLTKIKLLTSAKASLSDLLNVKTLLKSSITCSPNAVGQLLDILISELDDCLRNTPTMAPEILVDFLLTTGSRLTSEFCLYGTSSFPVGHFRQCCSIILSAINGISDQYSHVNVRGRARRIAHKWLFHGDDSKVSDEIKERVLRDRVQTKSHDTFRANEETISDFIMDLSTIHSSKKDHSGINFTSDNLKRNQTVSMEEPSAIHEWSGRELSESTSQLAALRIAFVLYISMPKPKQLSDDSKTKENRSVDKSVQNPKSHSKRLGLLAQLQTKKDVQDESSIFELGLELLQIVFAKSGSLSTIFKRINLNGSASNSSKISPIDQRSTITFAMRHRALRVACLLCPQSVLEEIVMAEGFFSDIDNLEKHNLRELSFAIFLVKEIEEIGLPLPHSEILQLSSMNFMSYARSLWRDHRDDTILAKAKGRFHLLLIELCLHGDTTDSTFVCHLLHEMGRWNLPRTLLLALSCMVEYQNRRNASPFSDKLKSSIVVSVSSTCSAIHHELGQNINSLLRGEGDSEEVLRTLDKLYIVIISLLESCEALVQLNKFIALLETGGSTSLIRTMLEKTSYYKERVERYLCGV